MQLHHFTFHDKMGGDNVSDSKLRDMSMDFSVMMIDLVKELKRKRENIISNQIGRSGTSIGADIYEARYAHSRADFAAKLQIALKEASETGYWIELLYKTEYIDEKKYNELNKRCSALRYMLVSSLNTVKNRSSRE